MTQYDYEFAVDSNAQTIAIRPEGTPLGHSQSEDNWELQFKADDENRVRVRLSPYALHELYQEVENIPPDARQIGHASENIVDDDPVPLGKDTPPPQENPILWHCYAEGYEIPKRLTTIDGFDLALYSFIS